MKDSEFKALCDDLDRARKKKSTKRNAVILAAGKDMADKREEGEDEQLTKALISATSVIGSKAACHLDLLRRQGKLPADVRTALLALDVPGDDA